MATEFEVVTVWLGVFPSAPRLEEYLEETYDDDDTPISQFARDQKIRFYDHDFVESSFHEEPSSDAIALLRGHSYSSSFGNDVVRRTTRPMNTVLLVWGNEIETPRSVVGADYTLELIGTFACDQSAEPL